jgi:hypothetical protein
MTAASVETRGHVVLLELLQVAAGRDVLKDRSDMSEDRREIKTYRKYLRNAYGGDFRSHARLEGLRQGKSQTSRE